MVTKWLTKGLQQQNFISLLFYGVGDVMLRGVVDDLFNRPGLTCVSVGVLLSQQTIEGQWSLLVVVIAPYFNPPPLFRPDEGLCARPTN